MSWLRGRLYGHPDLPVRWRLVLTAVTAQTVASWIVGRVR